MTLPRVGILLVALAAGLAGCDRPAGLPDASSAAYEDAVRAFHRGLAAVQVGESGVAEASFRRVTELAPGEPAGWANLGVVALLRGQPDSAATWLAEARDLAPENPRIRLASALAARERGDPAAAAEHLRAAADLDPEDPETLHLLALVVEEEQGAAGLNEARRIVGDILARHPRNLAALIERARLEARAGDASALRSTLDTVAGRLAEMPDAPGATLDSLRAAAGAGETARAAAALAFLRAELQPLEAFRQDQEAVTLSPGRTELLLGEFLRLTRPTARAAAPDTGLGFAAEPLEVGAGPTAWVRALWLEEGLPLAMVAGKRDGGVWIGTDPERGAAFRWPGSRGPLPLAGVEILDYDYDFRSDIALAGPGGLHLLRQGDDGAFTDVTDPAVPAAIRSRALAGVWAADVDLEGDMDLVAAPVAGAPILLINRGDGGFDTRAGFPGVARLRDFVWGDLDADGDPDAALLDADGALRVFLNRRQADPPFEPLAVPDTLGPIHALALTEMDGDAVLDLVVLDARGRVLLLSVDGAAWRVAAVAEWPELEPPTAGAVGGVRLFPADMDNNGEVDLVASVPAGAAGAAGALTRVWLRTPEGLRPHGTLDTRATDLADVSGGGRLDLLAVEGDGAASWLSNRGTRDYFATTIRPRASGSTGDRRINAFGIGGEIEVRAGLLYRKQPIQSPGVHFGLGEQAQVDVARILWPNGTVQAEFNLAATSETALATQRLKGSCPWVFAYDGESMSFVTDFLWRTALGLRINAQGDAAVIHSEDWIRIPGDRLRPRDGFYDIRITAELWESHFFDHVSLLVVDHPAGTEAFVDERFTLPAPEPAVQVTAPLRAVARALDHRGRDVTDRVLAVDEVYLDTFERGPYQGVAEDHWVEVDLGEPGEGAAAGPLRLVASGWIYPTDSSINIALAQGDHDAPRALSLEVPDGRGGWRTARSDLGFPAGKTKTIVLDLADLFPPGAERRLRLRTNMEIYWDRIAWTAAVPDATVRMERLLPATAELRYRGFSEVRQAGRAAPELPEYGRIAATTPIWRDLVGYHTRFGDVRPLNEAVDDRYVIMNAGDELALRFPAPPPPPAGWTRDFVLVGDGWVKDGDYNTGFSTTVLPLPYHGLMEYSQAPGRLEDDPAYRRHPEDWTQYHTRWVTPRDFHDALLPAARD